MTEDKNKNDHGTTPAEEEENEGGDNPFEEILEDIEDEEVREKVEKRLKSESAQKLKWREKQQKAEEARQELEQKLQTSNAPSQTEEPKKEKGKEKQEEDDERYSPQQIEERVDLRVKGYSKEEISSMEAYAKGKGISLSDAEQDPFVQGAIQTTREKAKSEEENMEPSSPSGEGKKQPTSYRDIQKMSTQEKDEFLKNKLKQARK